MDRRRSDNADWERVLSEGGGCEELFSGTELKDLAEMGSTKCSACAGNNQSQRSVSHVRG